jgi:hypothetical protein
VVDRGARQRAGGAGGAGAGVSRAARAREVSLPPAARPLAAHAAPQVARLLEQALAGGDGALGAHCIHELWMRGEFPGRIEAALEALWRSAGGSIPDWLPMRYIDWLPAAYEVALGFRGTCRGRSNLYLVLLDFADRSRGPYGVYVGVSHLTPAERFDQHKAGIRAAGSVLKRGIEVLTGPTLHLQRLARAEALRIEGLLAEALRDAGLLVEGGH